MIQITRTGAIIAPEHGEADRLAEQFRSQHYFVIRNLLEPSLLEEIRKRVLGSGFFNFDHDGIATELCMQEGVAMEMLRLLFNGTKWIDFVRAVTGCRAINRYGGRVYQIVPGLGHFDSWHGDLIEGRQVTMSLNLGTEPFEGGELELRRKGTQEHIATVHNTGRGDALFFRIDPGLEHRVKEVVGSVPKLALAGWYLDGQSFLSALHETVQPNGH